MSDFGQVSPELMRSSCNRPEGEPGQFLSDRIYGMILAGRPPRAGSRFDIVRENASHLPGFGSFAGLQFHLYQSEPDCSLFGPGQSSDNGPIDFPDLPGPELF